MATDYKTLKEKADYHWSEASRIWKAGPFDETGSRLFSREDESAYNFHMAEYNVLGERIQAEFPGEVSQAKAAQEVELQKSKQFLENWESPDCSDLVRHKTDFAPVKSARVEIDRLLKIYSEAQNENKG